MSYAKSREDFIAKVLQSDRDRSLSMDERVARVAARLQENPFTIEDEVVNIFCRLVNNDI